MLRRFTLLIFFSIATVMIPSPALAASRPVVTTGNATNVTQTSATLNGTVNPKGRTTTSRFEWGTTASYGNSTVDQYVGSGNSAVPVSAAISGLIANTVYHFRIRATNSVGTSFGSDKIFTTSSSGGIPPNWRSGVHTGSFPADYTAFQTWRGQPLAGTLQYTDRGSWAGLESPWFLGYSWPGEIVLAQPFWPEGSGGSLSACASGSYNSHWQTYGTTLVNNGLGNGLTEFAWEMNGDWFEWSYGTNTVGFISCWQQVVSAVRSTAPNAKFAWTINAHSSGATGNPMDAYPGDAYVDVIGIDAYDHYPKSTTDTEFNNQASAVAGIDWTLTQATTHGKQIAVPEWGVEQPLDANHGGDNPFFVTKMQDWFRTHASSLYMEMYFDAAQSTIFASPAANPNSGVEYKAGLHG